MHCETCGVEAPTRYVEFYQNIGMLFARRTVSVKQNLCRVCIGRYFRSYSLTTLFLGWWGTISLVLTPCILLNNGFRYLMALRLPRPNLTAMNVPLGENPPLPPVGSSSVRFKMVYGALVCCALLAAIAYYSVDFVQRHAPALNAKLHGGDVTDETDAEYRATQFFDDINQLSADTKSSDWPAFRSEMLTRQHYLDDLTEQNDKLQSRIALERSQNLGANDICEKLALDELAPAMDDYAKVEARTFAVLQRTVTPNDTALAYLSDLGKQEDAAEAKLRAYASDSDRHSCNK